MKNLSFDQIPEAICTLFAKMENIECLLVDAAKKPNQEEDQIFTVEECAEFLKLAKPTIYGLINKGQIPVMKRSKRCYFSKAELIKYLQEGKQKSHSEIEVNANSYQRAKAK